MCTPSSYLRIFFFFLFFWKNSLSWTHRILVWTDSAFARSWSSELSSYSSCRSNHECFLLIVYVYSVSSFSSSTWQHRKHAGLNWSVEPPTKRCKWSRKNQVEHRSMALARHLPLRAFTGLSKVHVCGPGSRTTRDIDDERVRVYVDENNRVTSKPNIG